MEHLRDTSGTCRGVNTKSSLRRRCGILGEYKLVGRALKEGDEVLKRMKYPADNKRKIGPLAVEQP